MVDSGIDIPERIPELPGGDFLFRNIPFIPLQQDPYGKIIITDLYCPVELHADGMFSIHVYGENQGVKDYGCFIRGINYYTGEALGTLRGTIDKGSFDFGLIMSMPKQSFNFSVVAGHMENGQEKIDSTYGPVSINVIEKPSEKKFPWWILLVIGGSITGIYLLARRKN